MTQLIKTIKGKHEVEYGKGRFDNWCIFLISPGKNRYAPSDIEYFTILQELGYKYGHKEIYDDFVKIYNLTTKFLDEKVLDLITEISEKYLEDSEQIEIWLTVIYAGMIAEENKENTKLRKRIKRLGMHQTLIDKLPPNVAANYSKGKPWRDLDNIMRGNGF